MCSILSCQRLKKVQSLLRCEESGKDAPDTLLAVMGIDSRFIEIVFFLCCISLWMQLQG